MRDEGLPELYRPKDITPKPLTPQHQHSAVIPVIKFIGFTFVLSTLLALFALFAQVRGWVNLTASYVVLVVMWLFGVAICFAVVASQRLPRRLALALTGSAIWALALIGLNALAPKPGASRTDRKSAPQLTDTKAPTLDALFNTDFPNLMKLTEGDAIGIRFENDGAILHIKRQLYLDFPAKTKFVGFYVRSALPFDHKSLLSLHETR